MKIQPKTLQKLRKRKRLSQQGLADEARIDKKTIARIESGKGGETRESTVNLIAKALRVDPEVLAQDPESEAVGDEVLRKLGFQQVKFNVDDTMVLAYDLVKDRYGVDMSQLFHAAPMLFTLLAEMSLTDRRRRAEEAEAAMEAFHEALPEHLTGRHWEAYEEKKSIAKRDLFGKLIETEWNGSYYDDDELRNPFSDFLKQLAKELSPENDAIDPEEIHFDPDTFFMYVPLFESYRKILTGGSQRADYAFFFGYVRLDQIPKHLRIEDEEDDHIVDERVEWLEKQVPDDVWVNLERLRPAEKSEIVNLFRPRGPRGPRPVISVIRGRPFIYESPSEGGTEDA